MLHSSISFIFEFPPCWSAAFLFNMAAKHSTDEKFAQMERIEHVETTDADLVKPKLEKVDEFGAHSKTDPKEIAIVKKIDWYMLVSVESCLLLLKIC